MESQTDWEKTAFTKSLQKWFFSHVHLHESVQVERQLVLFGFYKIRIVSPLSFCLSLPKWPKVRSSLRAQVTASEHFPESLPTVTPPIPPYPPNSPHINSLTFPYNLFPSSHPFLNKPIKRESLVGQKLDMGFAFFEAFGKLLQLLCFTFYSLKVLWTDAQCQSLYLSQLPRPAVAEIFSWWRSVFRKQRKML